MNNRTEIQPLPHHHGDPNKPCPGGDACPLFQTLADRGRQYGDYGDMSETAQAIKVVMFAGEMWDKLPAYERESLDVIATKIARIVTGGPGQRDSWHDIGGYAKLSEDRCPLPHELKRNATP